MANILYIDDNAQACLLVQVFLKKYGHHVTVAKDTRQAREILADGETDFIISDIGLPVESGIDFHQWLLQQEEYKDMPFLFTSAHAMGFDKDLVEHKEIFVQKPIFFPDLAEKIDKMLTSK